MDSIGLSNASLISSIENLWLLSNLNALPNFRTFCYEIDSQYIKIVKLEILHKKN